VPHRVTERASRWTSSCVSGSSSKTPKENHADLERLARLIEAGKLTPTIERTYPLEQAPEAMHHLQAGDARGKLVITVTDGVRAVQTAATPRT